MAYTLTGRLAGGEFASAIRGLALDGRDLLHVVGDDQVKVLDHRGRVLRGWRTSAPAWSIAVGPDGRVWVGEEGQIEVFEANGRLAATWRHSKRFGCVTAIDFVNGDVLAGDALGRAIRRCDGDGTFLNDIGADNRMQGFLIPNGVVQFAVDSTGTIHAANPGKHRVEQYTPNGKLLGYFGRFDGNDPAGFGGCCNPTNVVIGDTRIFVTEKAGPRAKVYDLEGRFAGVIADSVFDPNCKNMAIAVSTRGRVYVADTARLEILAFNSTTEASS